LLLLLKLYAYALDVSWMFANSVELRSLWAMRPLTNPSTFGMLQYHLGRPRLVYSQVESLHPFIRRSVALLFANAGVLTLGLAAVMLGSNAALPLVTEILAVLLSAASAAVLGGALLGHLALGPLDALSRDLDNKGPLRRVVVENPTAYRYFSYFVRLLVAAVLGGVASSLAMAVVQPGSFSGTATCIVHHCSVDPVPWLYFSVVTIATVGYGDIAPHSDFARLLTLSHIAAGPVLLSWVIAVFTGARGGEIPQGSPPVPSDAGPTRCRARNSARCVWSGCEHYLARPAESAPSEA